jgi:DNA mismatch repair ATPase MutS
MHTRTYPHTHAHTHTYPHTHTCTFKHREVLGLKELVKERVRPLHMDIMLAERESTAAREVVPLFKVVTGTASGSFGYACALAAGIGGHVVERAEHVGKAIENGEPIEPVFDNSTVSLDIVFTSSVLVLVAMRACMTPARVFGRVAASRANLARAVSPRRPTD